MRIYVWNFLVKTWSSPWFCTVYGQKLTRVLLETIGFHCLTPERILTLFMLCLFAMAFKLQGLGNRRLQGCQEEACATPSQLPMDVALAGAPQSAPEISAVGGAHAQQTYFGGGGGRGREECLYTSLRDCSCRTPMPGQGHSEGLQPHVTNTEAGTPWRTAVTGHPCWGRGSCLSHLLLFHNPWWI